MTEIGDGSSTSSVFESRRTLFAETEVILFISSFNNCAARSNTSTFPLVLVVVDRLLIADFVLFNARLLIATLNDPLG